MRCRVAVLAGWFALAALPGFQPRMFGAGLGTSSSTAGFRPEAQVVSNNVDTLDLNTATAGQLRELPGMGDAYVRRILDGRPYTAKNQLVTRGVLPQRVYEAIRERIVAHRVPRKP